MTTKVMTRKKRKILTYEIICKAMNGDVEAEEKIFDYYESYIIKLSRFPVKTIKGKVVYVIDEDIYMSLKLKLHELILNFRIL